jgi:1-phosphofructokinase/tagatose 6-phosphate kinase
MSTVLQTLYIGLSPALQRTTLYPSLQAGAVNRAIEAHVSAGGKATNALRAYHQVGGYGALFALVGGAQGEAFLRCLAEEKLRQMHIKIGRETRMCHTLIDQETAQITELVEEPHRVDETEIAALYHGLEDVSWPQQVAICGRLPVGISSCFYADLAMRAVASGATVCMDVVGEPLMAALEAQPLVKLNAHELKTTTGINDRHEAAEALLKLGAQSVLITDAHRPAYVYEQGSRCQVTLPEVGVLKNTTGCGDAVMGGLLYQLAQGASFLEASIYALACGIAATGTLLPAQLDLERLKQYHEPLIPERF